MDRPRVRGAMTTRCFRRVGPSSIGLNKSCFFATFIANLLSCFAVSERYPERASTVGPHCLNREPTVLNDVRCRKSPSFHRKAPRHRSLLERDAIALVHASPAQSSSPWHRSSRQKNHTTTVPTKAVSVYCSNLVSFQAITSHLCTKGANRNLPVLMEKSAGVPKATMMGYRPQSTQLLS